MAKSCKILKVTSTYVYPIIDTFQPKAKLEYESRELPRDKYDFSLIQTQIQPIDEEKVKVPLYVHVLQVKQEKLGHKFILRIEEPFYLSQLETEKTIILKTTFNAELFLYTDPQVDGYLAIFTPKTKLKRLIHAISQILGTQEWYTEIAFDLTNNEETLRKIFGNFILFYTTDIVHELVKSASLQGTHLEKSPEYKKYIKDFQGHISAIMIEYPFEENKKLKIMISASGRIYSPNKEFQEDTKYQIIKEIIETLKDHNIIRP